MNILKRTITSRFITWTSRSLIGNIVLFELLFGLPAFSVFSYMDYTRGILTPMRVIFVLVTCIINSIILGVIIWFGVARPAINRRNK